MNKYLLDANCFYSVSNNQTKKEKLFEIRNQLVISPISILEICRVDKAKEYIKRKRTLEALKFINVEILQETPDDLVARAFGQPEPQNSGNQVDWKQMINVFLQTKNYDELMKRFNLKLLSNWKKENSQWFTQEIVSGNKTERTANIKELTEKFKEKDVKEIKELSTIKAQESSIGKEGYYATLCGLSVRAGLNSSEDLKNSTKDGIINKEFVRKPFLSYNDNLESFIKMYQGFHFEMSQPGRTPERNALFDLDYFLYLDIYEDKFNFVTTEDFLITVGEKSIPGRVVSLDSILT